MFEKLIFVLIFLVSTRDAHVSDVFEYGDSDFDLKIKEHEIALVELYSPQCGFCVRLAPEYEIAATKLKKNDPPIALVKVDCTINKETCSKQQANGYPTLRIYKEGVRYADYDGPRDADGIVRYMKIKVGPPSLEINTVEEMDKFLSNPAQHRFAGKFEALVRS
jgi:protein disulfide isomerase family A protein 3